MVSEEVLTRATQEVDNKRASEHKSVECQLNHAASEFVSTDSCSTSTMSVKSEGDDAEQGVAVEGGNERHEDAQRGPPEPTLGASPSRRPMGWESPQGILPMGHTPYGPMSYAQYMSMMPGHPMEGPPGSMGEDGMYYPHYHGGYPMHPGYMMGGGSPPPGLGFYSVPMDIPSNGRASPPMCAGCSPHGYNGNSPPSGHYFYMPPMANAPEYPGGHHIRKSPSTTSVSSVEGSSPTKKGEARASARIARSTRAGGAYNPSDYQFDRTRAISGAPDARKTLMIRNIPNKYSQATMLDMLDKSGLSNTYDFFYLPKDFRNGAGLGYAFINFIDAKHTAILYDKFHNKRWDEHNSRKVCEITYGRVQGRDNLIDHFKSAKFPSSDPEYLPLIYEHQQTVSGKFVVHHRPLTIHEYLQKNSEDA